MPLPHPCSRPVCSGKEHTCVQTSVLGRQVPVPEPLLSVPTSPQFSRDRPLPSPPHAPPLTPTSLGTTPLSRVPAPGACLAASSPCRRAPSGRRENVGPRQKRLSARCTPASCSPRCRGRSTWAGTGRAWAPGSADVLSLSGASTVDPLSRGAYCGVRKPRVPPPTSVSPPVSWGLDGV